MSTNAKIATIATFAIAVLALGGCAKNDGPYGGHSEKWYMHHGSDRLAEIKWCNTQTLDANIKSKSCNLARDAETKIFLSANATANTSNMMKITPIPLQ